MLKNLLHIVVVLAAILGNAHAASAYLAPSGKITKVWLEHGVKYNGQNAMKIHASFNVKNMDGKRGYVNAWIKNPNGQFMKIHGANNDINGNSFVRQEYCPKSSDLNVEAWMVIYLKDMTVLPGTNTYSVIVTLTDDKYHSLSQSSPINFNSTGSSTTIKNNPATNGKQSANTVGKNNKIVRRWEEHKGTVTTIHTLFANGEENITTQMPCVVCNESGKCQTCHGTGQTYNRAYNQMFTCNTCLGSGKCTLCGGTGKSSITTFKNASGSMTGDYYDSYGKKIVPSDKKSKGSDSHTHKSSGTCSSCGGSGVQSTALYQNDPTGALANTVGEVAYTNHSGNKCKYCGKYSYHVHLKCPKCN